VFDQSVVASFPAHLAYLFSCFEMTSFPAASWQAALLTKQTGGRAIAGDPSYGRAATRIQNRLYLSDYWTARDAQQLRKLGITHIISLLECIPEFKDHDDVKKLHIAIQDTPEADILKYLDTTTVFIKDALAENEQNKVLIESRSTVSRALAAARLLCVHTCLRRRQWCLRRPLHT